MAISSSAENYHSHFVVYQPDTTGALAAAENDLRLLTSAAIEKLPFPAYIIDSREPEDGNAPRFSHSLAAEPTQKAGDQSRKRKWT
ncbi:MULTISPECIES: hypothetical protein [Sphingobium]|uniref:Uncharacterized protein n=2 Tax=Sphingobium TaxID=165695 RepID=A0A418YQ53_9SPHN|nr:MULTISPECIES: hypothetical protein [Sphingobium]QNG46052.1 hypothetical protein H3V42_30815 [Sphingobium yanoikuyae]RJG53611.1 hypothetical protein D0Z70_15270 [Sphingobium terrigena]